MNQWESNLDLHNNYNPNILCAPFNPDLLNLTLLDPAVEELRYRNGNFYSSVLVPPARGTLESLVAQATFLRATNFDQQPPSSVVNPSPAANMSSVPLEGVYTNMPNNMPFIDNKTSIPLVPASFHLNNDLASTASSSRDVKPNINDTCYQGKVPQLKVRKPRNKSKDQSAASLHTEKRRQGINRSLNELQTMSGATNYKVDIISMLEGVTNHMKLLRLQSKMANIMNIAPKEVTLAIQHHHKMCIDPHLKSGSVVRSMNSTMKGDNAAGIGLVETNNISPMSVVHPTTYVPSGESIDQVVAHTCASTIDPISPYVVTTPTIDPISVYVVAAGKSEVPSVDEVAELITSFEQLQQNLDCNLKS